MREKARDKKPRPMKEAFPFHCLVWKAFCTISLQNHEATNPKKGERMNSKSGSKMAGSKIYPHCWRWIKSAPDAWFPIL
jgi:hypothetical protein